MLNKILNYQKQFYDFLGFTLPCSSSKNAVLDWTGTKKRAIKKQFKLAKVDTSIGYASLFASFPIVIPCTTMEKRTII
jgi:hypothetical protein